MRVAKAVIKKKMRVAKAVVSGEENESSQGSGKRKW